MAEERKTESSTGSEEPRQSRAGGRMGDGIRQGIGVLSAFRDALEETIQEARDRGDLSADRAKEVMKEALGRAQAAAEGAKDRLDFAHHDELAGLEAAVESIRDRLAALEESVFGASRDTAATVGAATSEAPGAEGSVAAEPADSAAATSPPEADS